MRAVQTIVDESIARPILIGRRDVIERRLKKLSLRLKIGENFDHCDPDHDPRYHDYWTSYHRLMQRKGLTPIDARMVVRTTPTVIGALMVRKHEADAIVCGTAGNYSDHLKHILDVLGLKPGVCKASACEVVIVNSGTFFIVDPYVTPDPSPVEIAEMTMLAAEQVRRFGLQPKVALLSHSNFGTHDDALAKKMRDALELIERRSPKLEIEGEMQVDAALSEEVRHDLFPNSRLRGQANLLVMPTIDAANISFKMLKLLGDGSSIGPILLGVRRAAHILTPSTTVRGILNIAAVAAVDAQENEEWLTADN